MYSLAFLRSGADKYPDVDERNFLGSDLCQRHEADPFDSICRSANQLWIGA